MKTVELVPLALIAGVVANVNGCRLRGREINKTLINTAQEVIQPAELPPDVEVFHGSGLREAPKRQDSFLRKEMRNKFMEEGRRKNAREERIPKKESAEEARRHHEAAMNLAEACADEMTLYNCKLRFKPANCLRKHNPKSFACVTALKSWYHGEPRAEIQEPDMIPDWILGVDRADLQDRSGETTEAVPPVMWSAPLPHLVEEFNTEQWSSEENPIRHVHGNHVPGGPDRHGPHGPRGPPPHHHHHPHYHRGGERLEMNVDRSPRSSFTVLIDWLSGVDSSDSSSSGDTSVSWMLQSSDSSDSVDSDSDSDSVDWDFVEKIWRRPERRNKGRFPRKHSAADEVGWLDQETDVDLRVPDKMWMAYEPIRVDTDPLVEQALLRSERIDFSSESIRESSDLPNHLHHGHGKPADLPKHLHHGHGESVDLPNRVHHGHVKPVELPKHLHHGHGKPVDLPNRVHHGHVKPVELPKHLHHGHGKPADLPNHLHHGHGELANLPNHVHHVHHGHGGRFHDHSHHDHIRYRNRLPDDLDHSTWPDSFDRDFEDCDFVEGLLAFFFFVGSFTLLIMPFVLFARAMKRMVRGTSSPRFLRSSSTPPGPSSSAFSGFGRRRENSAAAAEAVAAGYQALPEEPFTPVEGGDDDAIVVTGTPVNPPPSVHI